MKKIKELEDYYIGKKFKGFSWVDDLDDVYFAGGLMNDLVGKEITINRIYELIDSEGLYSVSGKETEGYCYPLAYVDKHIIQDKTEEEITQDVFSLIKKVVK